MDNRKKKLLNLVVDNYVATAEPVGSRFLLSCGKFDCGEATIRNELRVLEQEGYLTHPHTSAGRLPTAKGYRYYIDNIDVTKLKLSKKHNDILGMTIADEIEPVQKRKNIAKVLTELSGQTVLLAISSDSLYYTGLSNLFLQPEFSELIADVSKVFDHCEQCIDDFYEKVGNDAEIFVSEEHPFGGMLSVVAGRFGNNSLIAMMGPLRMDYKKNICLLSKAIDIIHN